MGEKRWAVLYAKNSGKKKKKWLDGVLLVRGSAGRHAKVVLFDEAGSVLEEVGWQAHRQHLFSASRHT